MANFRQIHVGIWKDQWFMGLKPNAKLLFIYLFSNEQAAFCGLYKLPYRVMINETGLSEDEVNKYLDDFRREDKVYYDPKVGVVWVVNMGKYHDSQSPKVITRRVADVLAVPDCQPKILYLQRNIEYRYYIDTISLRKGKGKGIRKEKEDKEGALPLLPSPPRPSQHPALMAYRELVRRNVPTLMRDRVIEAIGDDPRKIDLWKTIITDWVARGWNPGNLAGLLDVYAQGGIKTKNGRPTTQPDILELERRRLENEDGN